MERVQPIEASLDLQPAEWDLDPPLREPPTRARAEERGSGIEALALRDLVPPELHELRLEPVRQEDVARAPALRDLGSEVDADTRLPTWQIDVADVESNELCKAEPRAQC
jgi:hypothetical protein